MIGSRLAIGAALLAGLAAAQSLDFDSYRTKVEPIFMKKRAGHARCVVCHSANNSGFKLQPLAKGVTAWTEEQSRKNFESVSHLVTPGDPAASRLLKHPLSPAPGGDLFHNGGQQFTGTDDPDYKIVADWIRSGK
jgi:hypothetical protein